MVPSGLDRVMNDQQLKDHWVKRVIAYIIDEVIVTAIFILIIFIGALIFIGAVIGGAMTGNVMGGVVGGLLIFLLLIMIALVFTVVYWIYFDAHGGTPGKKIMKLKPVALEGEMDYVKAAIRNGSKIVGGFIGGMFGTMIGETLFIPTIVASIIVLIDAFLGIDRGEDPRRKYTDYIAGTTVVRTDITETFAPAPETPPPPTTDMPPTTTSETPSAPVAVTPPVPVAGTTTAVATDTPPSTTTGPPKVVPTVTTKAPSMAVDDNAKLNEIRDSFLMGEITEEEYKRERSKLG